MVKVIHVFTILYRDQGTFNIKDGKTKKDFKSLVVPRYLPEELVTGSVYILNLKKMNLDILDNEQKSLVIVFFKDGKILPPLFFDEPLRRHNKNDNFDITVIVP